ncbi:MAG TPA: GDYXXLXY domain-containing protein [Planctomycetaceae bacterium]|nr:GDYXXLXY domain-containing protein [Planctomycetaceae bacterium]
MHDIIPASDSGSRSDLHTVDWLARTVGFVRARQRLVIFLSVMLQAAVLVGMIVFHALPYLVGDRILLRVIPIDPRDLFRGDYVILSYEITRVPPEGIDGIPQRGNWWSRRVNRDDWLHERRVFVGLEPEADGQHWHATSYSTRRPVSGKFICGKNTGNWTTPLEFGIEAYYVEEGKGRNIESMRNAKKLSAEVALAPWGQAKLVRLVEE